jgi:hypothetical protein
MARVVNIIHVEKIRNIPINTQSHFAEPDADYIETSFVIRGRRHSKNTTARAVRKNKMLPHRNGEAVEANKRQQR